MNILDITNCICIKGETMNEKQFIIIQDENAHKYKISKEIYQKMKEKYDDVGFSEFYYLISYDEYTDEEFEKEVSYLFGELKE